jgi:hypothetical protein
MRHYIRALHACVHEKPFDVAIAGAQYLVCQSPLHLLLTNRLMHGKQWAAWQQARYAWQAVGLPVHHSPRQ